MAAQLDIAVRDAFYLCCQRRSGDNLAFHFKILLKITLTQGLFGDLITLRGEGTWNVMADKSVAQGDSSKAYSQCNYVSASQPFLTDNKKLFEFDSAIVNGCPGIAIFMQIQSLSHIMH